MCLLITGSSNKIRQQLLSTPGLIEDIYDKNGDGLGVMYGTSEGLHTYKCLPPTPDAARAVIAGLPDDERDLAMHWRWRTHGDIDLDNCHPYQVSQTTALMHNGILSTGNAADVTKSDTWHFIQDYLIGVPDDVLHQAGFREMLGDFIGSNKFAIMSADGRLSVINKDQGISHDSVWYSNTYAWSPRLLIPGYGSYKGKKWGGYNYGGNKGHIHTNLTAWGMDDEDEVEALMYGSYGAGAGSAKASAQVFEQDGEDEADEYEQLCVKVENCLYDFDSSTLADLLESHFDIVVNYIMANYEITEYSRFRAQDYSAGYVSAVAAWVEYNSDALSTIDPGIVAEALMQCCDFEPIDEEDAETPASSTSLSLVK